MLSSPSAHSQQISLPIHSTITLSQGAAFKCIHWHMRRGLVATPSLVSVANSRFYLDLTIFSINILFPFQPRTSHCIWLSHFPSPLACDDSSPFSSFSWPWCSWGVLTRYAAEQPQACLLFKIYLLDCARSYWQHKWSWIFIVVCGLSSLTSRWAWAPCTGSVVF